MARILTAAERTAIDSIRSAVYGKLAGLDSVIGRMMNLEDPPAGYVRELDDLRRRFLMDIDGLAKLQAWDDKVKPA